MLRMGQGQEADSLARAVAKFGGLNQSTAGSLLGMLAPVVMGTIGQQRQQGRSLDASGITDLLASQKDNIAAALPPGVQQLAWWDGLARCARRCGADRNSRGQ